MPFLFFSFSRIASCGTTVFAVSSVARPLRRAHTFQNVFMYTDAILRPCVLLILVEVLRVWVCEGADYIH